MTAQEAAKEGWSWLKHYRWAAGLFAVGATVAAAGLYSDEIQSVGGVVGGIVMQGIGFASWMVERTAKKTGTELARGTSDQVVEKLRADLDDMRNAHMQSATAMLNLTTLFAESESARQQMHVENRGYTQTIQDRLDEHGEAIEHIGEAVRTLKPDWEPRQISNR